MKAILYARVSTDDKGQVPQQQIDDMRSWCTAQGVEIVAEYVDEGRTGANMQRPGMLQVMGHVMMGGVSMIIAQHPDRISRDAADTEALRKRLSSYGVIIRYTMMDIASETGAGRVVNYIYAAQGEDWLRDHSIKVRKGMRYAQNNGTKTGRPIGRPKADIDIDLVMELADAGYSVNRAASTLNYKRQTLCDFLKAQGRLEEYYSRCRKGIVPKTTDCIYTPAKKQEVR